MSRRIEKLMLKIIVVSLANKQKKHNWGPMANTTLSEGFVTSSVSSRELVKRSLVCSEAHSQVHSPAQEYDVISQTIHTFSQFLSIFNTDLFPLLPSRS